MTGTKQALEVASGRAMIPWRRGLVAAVLGSVGGGAVGGGDVYLIDRRREARRTK